MQNVNWMPEEVSSIQGETPSVMNLPTDKRYRSFSSSNRVRVRATSDVNDFCVVKKRRFESPIGFYTPVQTKKTSPIAVRSHQNSTYNWLLKNPDPKSILPRFSVDRRIGAPPNLASQNHAIRLFMEGRSTAILDLVEEVVLDGGTVAVSTLQLVIDALKAQPQRAARFALFLRDQNDSREIPLKLWGDLANHFAEAENSTGVSFFKAFKEVVMMLTRRNTKLPDKIVVALGKQCIQNNDDASFVKQLVNERLFSQRSAISDHSSSNALGAFLSDLFCFVIQQSEKALDVGFLTDTIRFASQRRLVLHSKTMERCVAILREKSLHRELCILFLTMCSMAVPNSFCVLSFFESLEKTTFSETELQHLFGHKSPCVLLLWCLTTFPSLLGPNDSSSVDFYEASTLLVRLCLQDYMENGFGYLLALLASRNSLLARYTLSLFLSELRKGNFTQEKGTPSGVSDGLALQVALQLPHTPRTVHGSLSEYLANEVRLEGEKYCNVLSAAAFRIIASQSSAYTAFVNLMNRYATKGGAAVLLFVESLVTLDGKETLRSLKDMSESLPWFHLAPLSVSFQFTQDTLLGAAADLCQHIAANGHKKIALLCAPGEISTAKSLSTPNVISVVDLLKKLGVVLNGE